MPKSVLMHKDKQMKKILFVFLSLFLLTCVSAKSIKASDIIPDGCSNAVMLLVDRRPGNYNKQEYFYLDDADEIRAIFSEWKNLKRLPLFPYHFDAGFNCTYDVHLVINGEKVPCLIDGISPDGQMINLNYHGYEYKSEYWERLKAKLKPAKKEIINYSSVSEYRSAIEKIKKDGNYIYSECNLMVAGQSVPDICDGYFYMTTKNPSWSAVEKKISKAYPDAVFIIGGQLGTGFYSSCDYRIYTTKELYEKFDLYPKKEFIEFDDIRVTVFLKE